MPRHAPNLCSKGHDTNPAEVFSEAEKLASLRHPCVMAFYGIVTSPDAYATVAEYICHGSLRGGLTKIRKKVGGCWGVGAGGDGETVGANRQVTYECVAICLLAQLFSETRPLCT
jgi:serine/threonine protein kinase